MCGHGWRIRHVGAALVPRKATLGSGPRGSVKAARIEIYRFLRFQRIYSGYTCNTSHYDVLAGVYLKTLGPLILSKALVHYVETRNASYRPLENAISTGASLAPVVSPGAL